MPACILQAWTTCTQYVNMKDANRGMVLRILHENVVELHGLKKAKSLTPLEKVARTHALMLYQTIRMFDGDITLNSQADKDFPLLDDWVNDLCKIRDNLMDEAIMDEETIRSQPPESWEVCVPDKQINLWRLTITLLSGGSSRRVSDEPAYLATALSLFGSS